MEFNSWEFREMAEKFNIEIKTAYSPWSNGLMGNTTSLSLKSSIKSEMITSVKTPQPLRWAVMAKISMYNEHGFSPYQLVFG